MLAAEQQQQDAFEREKFDYMKRQDFLDRRDAGRARRDASKPDPGQRARDTAMVLALAKEDGINPIPLLRQLGYKNPQAVYKRFLKSGAASAAATTAANAADLTPASEATNRSTGFIMGYNSSGELVPFRGPNGKPIPYKPKPSGRGGSKGERTDYFYAVREDAVKAAKELAERKENEFGNMVLVPRDEAYQRLWTEFGQLLIGRGYAKRAVEQMLQRALRAAGYR